MLENNQYFKICKNISSTVICTEWLSHKKTFLVVIFWPKQFIYEKYIRKYFLVL